MFLSLRIWALSCLAPHCPHGITFANPDIGLHGYQQLAQVLGEVLAASMSWRHQACLYPSLGSTHAAIYALDVGMGYISRMQCLEGCFHCCRIEAARCCACRLLKYPEMRRTFYIREGQGDAQQWRTPRVNETCCARPALATLLDKVAVFGPSAVDDHAQACSITHRHCYRHVHAGCRCCMVKNCLELTLLLCSVVNEAC